MLWSIIPLRTVAGVWMSEFRDLPSLVWLCLAYSIRYRLQLSAHLSIALAWMGEFIDVPSLVYLLVPRHEALRLASRMLPLYSSALWSPIRCCPGDIPSR